MIRTVREATEYLLRYLSPEEQAIPATKQEDENGNLVECYPGRIEAAIQAINGALQEIFSFGALHQARRDFGVIINAPEEVTFEVNPGLVSIRFSQNNWKSWMMGCTCRIDGDPLDNRIIDYDALSSTLTLVRPYNGESGGEKSTTVWHDSISPDPLVGEILNMSISYEGPLQPVDSPRFLEQRTHQEEDFGFQGKNSLLNGYSFSGNLTDYVGVPDQYFVDTLHRPTEPPERRVRLFPLPRKSYVMDYRARVVPPQFKKEAIYLTLPTELSVQTLGFPVFVTFTWDQASQRYKTDPETTEVYEEENVWRYGINTESYNAPSTPGPKYHKGPAGTYSHDYLVGGTSYEFSIIVSDSSEVIPTKQPEVALPIHNDWIESIFLPMAAQRFQVSPFFRNDSATDEIKRQYQAALEILKTTAPQTKQGRWLKPIYG